MPPAAPQHVDVTYHRAHVIPLIVVNCLLGMASLALILALNIVLPQREAFAAVRVLITLSQVLLLVSIAMSVGSLIASQDQRLVADASGLRRERHGHAQWQTSWSDVAEVRIRRYRRIQRICVVERPEVAHWRPSLLVTWAFGMPAKSMFVCVNPDAAAPIAAMCAGRGIPVTTG